MTRPVKYVVGDVSKDGTVIHANVSIMTNDQGRLAVFSGKAKNPPIATYSLDEVTYRITGNCSACKGYPPKTTMWRIWDQQERASV